MPSTFLNFLKTMCTIFIGTPYLYTGLLLQVTLIKEEKVHFMTLKIMFSLTFFRFCCSPKQSVIIQETKSACCTADIPHFLCTCNFCQICPKSNSIKEKAYVRLLYNQNYLPHFRNHKNYVNFDGHHK